MKRVSRVSFTFCTWKDCFHSVVNNFFFKSRNVNYLSLFWLRGACECALKDHSLSLFPSLFFSPLLCWFCVGGMWRLWVCLFPVVKAASCLCGCGGAFSLHESSWAQHVSPRGHSTVAQSLRKYAPLNQLHLTGNHLSYWRAANPTLWTIVIMVPTPMKTLQMQLFQNPPYVFWV